MLLNLYFKKTSKGKIKAKAELILAESREEYTLDEMQTGFLLAIINIAFITNGITTSDVVASKENEAQISLTLDDNLYDVIKAILEPKIEIKEGLLIFDSRIDKNSLEFLIQQVALNRLSKEYFIMPMSGQ